MTHASAQLEYAPPPRWHQRPRARWVIIAAIVLTLLPLGIRYGRIGYERMRINRLMRACLAHTPATIVFAEDRLQASHVPATWTNLARHFGETLSSDATVFLHQRFTPDGRRVLVAVDLAELRRGQPLIAAFVVRVIEPASMLGLPRNVTFDVLPETLDDQDGVVRIMGGQIDAGDATHFTVRYTVADRPGVIDGWILSDGSVKLEARTRE